jgi:hypothetical protein
MIASHADCREPKLLWSVITTGRLQLVIPRGRKIAICRERWEEHWYRWWSSPTHPGWLCSLHPGRAPPRRMDAMISGRCGQRRLPRQAVGENNGVLDVFVKREWVRCQRCRSPSESAGFPFGIESCFSGLKPKTTMPVFSSQFGTPDSAQCAFNAHCSNSFVFGKNCPNFD